MPSPSDKQPWLEIGFGKEEAVNALQIEEHIGVCATRRFELQYKQNGKWETLCKSNEIGLDYTLLFPTMKTTGIRLLIKEQAGDPRISALRAFYVNGNLVPDQVLAAEQARVSGPVKLEPGGYLGYWIEGSEVSWKVRSKGSKKYELALEPSCPGGQGGEAVVLVNGKEALAFEVPRSKDWNAYITTKVGTLDLPDGESWISIRARTFNGFALMNLKKAMLSEIPD
jgi:hypothetical protein